MTSVRRTPTLRDAEALVGLPYVEGSFDCGHLAVRAARELFGLEVALPLAQPHPVADRAQGAALALCRRELARRVTAPEPGDLALFTEARGAGRGWHVGTVIVTAPEIWVLHTLQDLGSTLQRLADCTRSGMQLDGWFRWHECTPVPGHERSFKLAGYWAMSTIELCAPAAAHSGPLGRWLDTRPMLDHESLGPEELEMNAECLAWALDAGQVLRHPEHPHLVRVVDTTAASDQGSPA